MAKAIRVKKINTDNPRKQPSTHVQTYFYHRNLLDFSAFFPLLPSSSLFFSPRITRFFLSNPPFSSPRITRSFLSPHFPPRPHSYRTFSRVFARPLNDAVLETNEIRHFRSFQTQRCSRKVQIPTILFGSRTITSPKRTIPLLFVRFKCGVAVFSYLYGVFYKKHEWLLRFKALEEPQRAPGFVSCMDSRIIAILRLRVSPPSRRLPWYSCQEPCRSQTAPRDRDRVSRRFHPGPGGAPVPRGPACRSGNRGARKKW